MVPPLTCPARVLDEEASREGTWSRLNTVADIGAQSLSSLANRHVVEVASWPGVVPYEQAIHHLYLRPLGHQRFNDSTFWRSSSTDGSCSCSALYRMIHRMSESACCSRTMLLRS